jgi:hypothetical protein
MESIRNKARASLLLLTMANLLTVHACLHADGVFVAPKFVWNKQKDINEPTQKAIIGYDAGQEDLILQVKYEGPLNEFGWLIPVPNRPTVTLGAMKCFYELSQYTQRNFNSRNQYSVAAAGSGDGSANSADQTPPVKVEEIKTVGAYEIAVLSTRDSGALETWLQSNQFYFPTNQAAVLDSYVQQQWYFVAVKIKLDRSSSRSNATADELAEGELNPLQISFASDRCVFPLKISSVNGHPSEVQVYVLSPEPLLEKTLLEQKLPEMYTNDLAQAAVRAKLVQESEARHQQTKARFGSGGLLPDPSRERQLQELATKPIAKPEELLPFAKVTKADLPACRKSIPRLAHGSWWLTKKTWTFQPEEMRDLVFEPAIPFLVGQLGSQAGYFAIANLQVLGTNATPALIAALQNTNPAVRIDAASVLNDQVRLLPDPKLAEAAVGWLKDTEPEVRTAAIYVLTDRLNWNPRYASPLVAAALREEDAGVGHALAFALRRHPEVVTNHLPAIEKLLQDQNPRIRISAAKILCHCGIPVPRDVFLSLLNVPDRELLGLMASQLRIKNPRGGYLKYDMSDIEAAPLFQNPDALARMIGLNVLYNNATNRSVEMALPLLKDPEPTIRTRAAATLRALTGQHFTEAQAEQWQQWWDAHKANFVVELHPEELHPQRIRPGDNAPTPASPPDS